MKALTLWQPWASLTMIPRRNVLELTPTGTSTDGFRGLYRSSPVPIKTIETRSWPAPKSIIGQRIAIHAAVTDKPFRDLDAPSLSSERTVIDAVLEALGVVELDQDGRQFWPTPWIEKGERICIGDVTLPLGAIIGSAVLADCVPMVSPRWTDFVRPYLWVNEDQIDAPADIVLYRDGGSGENVDDQKLFGFYEAGRWAWLLADPRPLDGPIPCRGAQGLWNVPADIEERLW